MIERNVIKFGYGTIGIAVCSLTQTMIFEHIKSPMGIGEKYDVRNVEVIGERFAVSLNPMLYQEYMENLDKVESGAIRSFKFGGYVFDFTNYHIDSVNVCRRKAEAAMSLYFMGLAV